MKCRHHGRSRGRNSLCSSTCPFEWHPPRRRLRVLIQAAINSLLGQLQHLVDPTPEPAANDALKALERLGVFQECQAILKLVQKALAKCEQIHGSELSKFGRRLVWPFKEKETKDSLQRLHHLRGLLANAVEANSASALRRIETNQDSMMEEVKFLSSSARSQIDQSEMYDVTAWLCPHATDGARVSLENALSRRLDGTGEWFLRSRCFDKWAQSECDTLWITGLPGAGKTLLCSSIIEKVRERESPNTAVLFFFCDHHDHSKTKHENFMMSVIKQMLTISTECQALAKGLYEKRDRSSRRFDSAEYPSLIRSFLRQFSKVYIILDALDEATTSDGEKIADTLTEMYNFGKHESINIKILFTSRFDVLFERKHILITRNRVSLAENMREDIELFIRTELDGRVARGLLKIRDRSLLGVIEEKVGAYAGTFLHARTQLDYLSTAKYDKDIKAMILNLPNGVMQTYQALLCHTASRNPHRVGEIKLLLQALSVAASPFSAVQLSEIIALQPGERTLDFDTVATDPYDTLEVIAPFVVIDRQEGVQEVIKLSHFSLDEYLCSQRIRHSPASVFYVDIAESHVWLASVCLQYLTLDIFNTDVQHNTDAELLNKYTFWRYAAYYWNRHIFAASSHPSLKEKCFPYLDRFVDGGDGPKCYQRWQKYLERALPFSDGYFHSPIGFVIWAQLNDIFEYLLPMVPTIDHEFADGFTCLAVAAKSNNVVAARKLLALGANVSKPITTNKLTPLHLAAEAGTEEIFDLLLEAGADPHARTETETTPFYRACRGGNEYILKRLKDCGSDVNALTYDNWTPLLEAVSVGHEHLVDLLLEWGADPTIGSGMDGKTNPLKMARINNDQSIVEKLQKIISPGDAILVDEEMDSEGSSDWE